MRERHFRRHPFAVLHVPGAEAAPIEALLHASSQGTVGLHRSAGRLQATTVPGGPPRLVAATSGSTGTPKRFHRSQESWIRSFEIDAGLFGIGPGRRVATLGSPEATLPLYGALEALHLGARTWMLHALRPDRQVQALAAAGVQVLWATPVQIRQLAHAAARRALPPLPAMNDLLIGGAALDAATRAQAGALCPNARIHEFYGASETSFIALSGPRTPPGLLGAPYPGVEIAIRDAEGHDCPTGIDGFLWVASPYLFDGYEDGDARGNPDLRRRDGAICIGELGAWIPDPEGGAPLLRLTGREGRTVQIADRLMRLDSAEADLRTIPGVEEAALLARSDARRGAVLSAHLLAAPGRALDPAEAERACRALLGPRAGLRRVTVHDSWPRLASGKTDLGRLAALEDEGGSASSRGTA